MEDWNGDGRRNDLDSWDLLEDTNKAVPSFHMGGRVKALIGIIVICLLIACVSPLLAKLIFFGLLICFVAFP